MLKLDPANYEITCPSGDTGMLLVKLCALDGQPLPHPISGAAVFSVCQQTGKTGYRTVSSLAVPIVDNTASIIISNAFSRKITAGNYFWDVRIVTDPEYVIDADGNQTVKCEDLTDEVHSIFAARKNGMPVYNVPGVAINV